MKMPEHIDDLYTLVHPGFGAFTEREVTPVHRELFRRYDELADLIDERRLLLAILVSPLEQRVSYHQFVAENISAMKERLRSRMIVISQGLHFANDTPRAAADMLRARHVAAARGFVIDADTRSHLAGETFKACVPTVGRIIQREFQLRLPGVIHAHVTNVGVREGETPDAQRARFADIADQRHLPGMTVDWRVPGAHADS